MEGLTEKITQILSDPEMISNIKSISGLLGSSEKSQNQENEDESPKTDGEESSGFSLPPEIIGMVFKLMPILSSLNSEDKYTKFLEALRPLLSDEKQKKLDSCSGILKIMRILPLLKNQGIL